MNRSAFYPLFICVSLASACLTLSATGDTQDEPERKFAKSYEGEDLSGMDLSKKRLDNTNFRNANLTNTNLSDASLKDCDFNGATIKNTNFTRVDLTGSDFREATLVHPILQMATLNKVNFSELDLSTLQFNELKLRGANFRNVKGFWIIQGSDFFGADLRGANLTNADEYVLSPAIFRKARYDQFTRWHKKFDPKERGAVFSETAPDADDKDKKKDAEKNLSNNDRATPEAYFRKLDGNSDGVLSGKEMSGYKDRDTNSDGDVTLAEFLKSAK